jgi:hypothetical protein
MLFYWVCLRMHYVNCWLDWFILYSLFLRSLNPLCLFFIFVFLMVLVLLALKFCSCSIFSSVSSTQFFLQFWSWILGFDVNGIKESKCNVLVIFMSFLIGMMCTMKIYIFLHEVFYFLWQGFLLFLFKPFWRQCFVI